MAIRVESDCKKVETKSTPIQIVCDLQWQCHTCRMCRNENSLQKDKERREKGEAQEFRCGRESEKVKWLSRLKGSVEVVVVVEVVAVVVVV